MSLGVHQTNQALLEPYAYLKQIPGKDFRGHLIDCFQLWLDIPPEKVVAIKEIIDSLHNASLLIDDIEDGSSLRRGVPVAHKICE
jgi:geranylgeranyl diphosphate synthase type 3